MDWSDSRNYCSTLGTTLATITSDSNQLDVEWVCLNATTNISEGCWIGLNDMDKDGKWSWNDWSSINYGFQNMNASNPAITSFPWYNKEPVNGLCIELNVNYSYKWKDNVCLATTAYPLCNDIPSRYMIGVNKSSWFQAKGYCRDRGVTLATIISNDSLIEAQNLCKATTSQKGCWVGLNNIDGNHSIYKWDDGTNVDFAFYNKDPTMPKTGKFPWKPGEPSVGGEYCIEIYAEYFYLLNDIPCSNPKRGNPICNAAPPTREYFIGPNTMNYTDAENYCIQYGSHLATIHSIQQQKLAANLCLTRAQTNISSGCWIGLNQRNSLGTWQWIEFQGGTSVSFGFNDNNGSDPTNGIIPWGINKLGTIKQPDGDGNCVLLRNADGLQWNNGLCLDTANQYPLCNKPPTPSPTYVPTANPTIHPTIIPSINPTVGPTSYTNEPFDGWITSNLTLPRGDSIMAVGFYNDSFHILGGFDYPRALVEYNVATNKVIDHGNVSSKISVDTFGKGRFYVTDNNIMYMIDPSGDKLSYYNLKTTQFIANWNNISIPINVGFGACIEAISNYLFIVGGGEPAPEKRNALQIYSIINNKWIMNAPSMNKRRFRLTCNIDGNNNMLYAIAGSSDSTLFENTIEAINISQIELIHNESWQYISGQLLFGVYSAHSIVYEESIIVFGGYSNSLKRDIQVIDINSEQVSYGGMINYGIEAPASIIINNHMIYLFGGNGGQSYGREKTWQYLALPTPTPTSSPTLNPSNPTANPSSIPSINPTIDPSYNPSINPTSAPTTDPIISPTKNLTVNTTAPTTTEPTTSLPTTTAPTPINTTEQTTSSPTTTIPTTTTRITTTAPTKYCGFGTYFIVNNVMREEKEYNNSKDIDNVILYGGESIISQNCVYLLKLHFSGNLVLYNINEKMIVWQTNTLLINDYQDTELKSINIKFFFDLNSLWLTEDKFPTIYHIKPYVLWNNEIIYDAATGYKLIVQNDGFVLLIDENENIIWKIPKINATLSTTETGSTSQEIDQLGDKNENEFDASMDLLWLWIILSLFIICCITYMFYPRFCKKRENKNNNELITVIDRLDTNHDDTSNEKNQHYVEDEMIVNWINSTNCEVINDGESRMNQEIELQQMMNNHNNNNEDENHSSSSSIMLGGIEGNYNATNDDD